MKEFTIINFIQFDNVEKNMRVHSFGFHNIKNLITKILFLEKKKLQIDGLHLVLVKFMRNLN